MLIVHQKQQMILNAKNKKLQEVRFFSTHISITARKNIVSNRNTISLFEVYLCDFCADKLGYWKMKHLKSIFFLVSLSFQLKAQLLFNMGNYRNIAYTSLGYSTFFGNATIGIARREYFRLIKRELIGILDVSLPLSDIYFTKQVIRKAFQLNLYENNRFKIPFCFASSSILRKDSFFKYHDITAEFIFNPGIYSEKYTIALDVRYELIVFRHIKYSQLYRQEINSKAMNNWVNPIFSVYKLGIIGGLNFKKWVFYLKAGYERNPITFNKNFPAYFVFGLGFKFGTKAMKKQ